MLTELVEMVSKKLKFLTYHMLVRAMAHYVVFRTRLAHKALHLFKGGGLPFQGGQQLLTLQAIIRGANGGTPTVALLFSSTECFKYSTHSFPRFVTKLRQQRDPSDRRSGRRPSRRCLYSSRLR